MELSVTGRLKRAAQTARPQVQKAPEEKTRVQQRREDRLTLSKQALTMLEEQNRQARERRAKEIEEKKQGADAEIDAMTKALKKMLKCQKIAARIMAGDKVPPKAAGNPQALWKRSPPRQNKKKQRQVFSGPPLFFYGVSSS